MSLHVSGVTLWLGGDETAELVAEADRCAPLETGGVLLGWRRGQHVVARHWLGPGPEARHGRTWLHPDSDWQAERIAELYEASGRRLAYLGDWHTHPGGVPSPSRRDQKTLRRIAAEPEARCPHPVMVILGKPAADTGSGWRIGAFTLRPRRWPLSRATAVPLHTRGYPSPAPEAEPRGVTTSAGRPPAGLLRGCRAHG